MCPDFDFDCAPVEKHRPCPRHRTGAAAKIIAVRPGRQLHDRRVGAGRRAEPDCRRRYGGRRRAVCPRNQRQCAADAAVHPDLKIAAFPLIQRQLRDDPAIQAVLNAADASTAVHPHLNKGLPCQVGDDPRRQYQIVVAHQLQNLQINQTAENILRQRCQAVAGQ